MEARGKGKVMHGTENSQAQKIGSPSSAAWRRAIVASSVVFALLGMGVVCTPAVVNHTNVRNQILGSSFEHLGLTTVTSEATGGWVQPVAFQGIELKDGQGRTVCRIREIRTSKGFLGFLTGDADLGQITLVEPDTDIYLNADGSWPMSFPSTPSSVTCDFQIESGKLRLHVPWRTMPIVDLSDLQISGNVARREDGRRQLTVGAFQVFDRQLLSDAQAQQNLTLIAPVLSQSTELTGSASLWMDEFVVLLDSDDGHAPRPFPITGRAQFHTLHARLRPDWARQLSLLTGQLAGRHVPDRLEILRDSNVEFSVSEQGMFHESMTFVLPELAQGLTAETRGLIGLDETLDLLLTVRMPPVAAGDQRPLPSLASQLTQQPLELVVRGTVSNPQLQAPAGLTLLDELTRRLAPGQHSASPKPVSQAVFELIQGTSQPNDEQIQRDLPGGILNLIRSIKADKERSDQVDP